MLPSLTLCSQYHSWSYCSLDAGHGAVFFGECRGSIVNKLCWPMLGCVMDFLEWSSKGRCWRIMGPAREVLWFDVMETGTEAPGFVVAKRRGTKRVKTGRGRRREFIDVSVECTSLAFVQIHVSIAWRAGRSFGQLMKCKANCSAKGCSARLQCIAGVVWGVPSDFGGSGPTLLRSSFDP